MKLKYKNQIEELGLSEPCPSVECKGINTYAFRWVLAPISHEHNFLPNIEYDKARGKEANLSGYNDNAKCLRCSQSFFISKSYALDVFMNFTPSIQRKMGYTHVAKGNLENTDGIMTLVNNNGHFSFFEFEESHYKTNFLIIDELN